MFVQRDHALAPPLHPPPPPVAPLRPPSDTESGELVDEGTPTPTPRRGGTHATTTGFYAHQSAAAGGHHQQVPTHHLAVRTDASAPQPSPTNPHIPQHPAAQHTAQPPADPMPTNSAAAPAATSAPPQQPPATSLGVDPQGIPEWLGSRDATPTHSGSKAHGGMHHATPHSHSHNSHATHAHGMLPQHPEAPWGDVQMRSAGASPVPGSVVHDPHAQHLMHSHNALGGYGTPEPFADPDFAGPGMPGHAAHQHFLMTMPFHQHNQHAQLAMQAPPGGAHAHGNAFYPPGAGIPPGWNNDREHSGCQGALPGSHSNSRTPSPFAAAPPGRPPAPTAEAMPSPNRLAKDSMAAEQIQPSTWGVPMPSSNSSSPLPALPGALPSQALHAPPGVVHSRPPGLHCRAPPVAPPPGAPPPFHQMGPGPGGNIEMAGWGNMGAMGIPEPNGSFPVPPGQLGFSRPPANGMPQVPGQWSKCPGQRNQGDHASPQKGATPQKPAPPWR